jgi:hypothetical protein
VKYKLSKFSSGVVSFPYPRLIERTQFVSRLITFFISTSKSNSTSPAPAETGAFYFSFVIPAKAGMTSYARMPDIQKGMTIINDQ